ncbi:MAG: glutamate synthase large subunit [Polyangiaceae bacterium]|nr:glutamate synthase large subunit [Polyangiaceae bacterium]
MDEARDEVQARRRGRALRRKLRERFVAHPGRGGCGVGAIAELHAPPSHALVKLALTGLGCLEHRGGGIDDTGDGAGLLLSTDRAFFERFIAPGRRLPEGHHLSVGMLFLPVGEASNLPHWQHEIEATLRRAGLQPLGWRHVPVDESVLGRGARTSRRDVWQVLVGEGLVPSEDLAKTLHRVKATLEVQIRDLYVVSLSPSTLVYKALATGDQLGRFYADLRDPALKTDVVVFHRRYSTNTFSNWYLAQVFRTLGHNGEINTIKANRNAVQNLETELGLGPILMPQGSDSADLDRMVEFLVAHDISLLESVYRLMPPAWRDRPAMPAEARRFFSGVERALGTLGAWEGPAAIVASDGRYLVGALDRMGLRPLRYLATRSGRIFIGSELGSMSVAFEDIAETGQLDPGEALAVDLVARRLLRPAEVVERVLAETAINFGELSEHRLVPLSLATRPSLPSGRGPDSERPATPSPAKADRAALSTFGWTPERMRTVRHVAETGKEPITSMGNDRPLAPFSSARPPISKFFKQIVAVVTNPPLDPIREGGAFDLTVHLGAAPAVHENVPVYEPRPQYQLRSPFLTAEELAVIVGADTPVRPRAAVLDASFDDPGSGTAAGGKAISRRIAELCRAALGLVKKEQASILVLSDKGGLVPGKLPLPMVLMVSALHNALVQEGRRRHAGLVVDTGEVQEGHDAAVLIANGADAVHPHLYFEVGAPHGSVEHLLRGLEDTLRRVMSKMGICSVDGYRGSRLFEAVGLAPDLVEHYLPGITSRIGGLDLDDLYADLRERRALGTSLLRDPDPNVYRKEVWSELQTTARGHDPASYGRFVALVEATPPVYLRDLLRLRPVAVPLARDEVASVEAIAAAVFRGAAMSHGALHRVAHRAIAAAFNELGAASNCGEGGEDPRRDRGEPWEASRSRIRQVASGRFGVDARYLVNADELSIKIGQGAKPGEGGMLPGAKVTAEVARIRRTQVGITLISPPPHHDIYSIEDLAELVYDLRQAHPAARVSVKIPAVTDIGTIAVGIAKAGADIIEVSGFEGGTGAAASSSIEHAGLPLERGLSETHQALVINGIRDRVRLRADGGIKTGFDIATVLALGADEVSLGTALMVAEQCIFCHGCANGMCPAGITTQDELVARRLMTLKKGRPSDAALEEGDDDRYEDAKNGVLHYLRALAADMRDKLALLGLRHPRELTGRVDLLEQKPTGEPRKDKVDLSELLVDMRDGPRPGAGPGPTGPAPLAAAERRLPLDPTSELNLRLCADAAAGRELRYDVTTSDRAVGATLAGRIAARVIDPGAGLRLMLRGWAGQALGFALVEGMHLELEGFANDKVAEAMSGGVVVVRAPRETPSDARLPLSLCGNAAAYGATGGALHVAGAAGQRVGVRNSGATIMVEGAGKYAFEYMTGGVGVVLGPVGPVVASGMTGGVVYLLGEGDPALGDKVHGDGKVQSLTRADEERLAELLLCHAEETGSARAEVLRKRLLDGERDFVKVVPRGG